MLAPGECCGECDLLFDVQSLFTLSSQVSRASEVEGDKFHWKPTRNFVSAVPEVNTCTSVLTVCSPMVLAGLVLVVVSLATLVRRLQLRSTSSCFAH